MDDAGAPPTTTYWELYVDADGTSRQRRREMHGFHPASMGGAAPQWNAEQAARPQKVIFAVQPVGWVGDWHENPARQWIVPLTGRWFVESMDGQRVEMGPGEIAFGEDQNTREANGRKGHLSGTVGDVPAVLMVVQFATPPTVASPCRFR